MLAGLVWEVVVAIVIVTTLCAAGALFNIRFLIALCKDRNSRGFCHVVSVAPRPLARGEREQARLRPFVRMAGGGRFARRQRLQSVVWEVGTDADRKTETMPVPIDIDMPSGRRARSGGAYR